MKEIVFLLEESSAEVFLEQIIHRIVDLERIKVTYVTFQGKSDLSEKLVKKMRGWCNREAKFIVMHDKDSNDCRNLKHDLVTKCKPTGRPFKVRIACTELESFFLGDLKAVEKAFNINKLALRQSEAKFRDPDKLANSSQELTKLTNQRYQKISGSREISKHLDFQVNKSASFRILVKTIEEFASN